MDCTSRCKFMSVTFETGVDFIIYYNIKHKYITQTNQSVSKYGLVWVNDECMSKIKIIINPLLCI